MNIIFLRHLPTPNNLSDTFIGRLDLDCDPSYISEHSETIENLQNHLTDFRALFCSPLKRAVHTAELLFPNRERILDTRLIERDLGDWSNVPKSLLRKECADAFYANGRMNFSVTPSGGEPFKALVMRAANFIISLYREYGETDTVVVVTHNGVITAVKCIMQQNFKDTSGFSFQGYLDPYNITLDASTAKYIESVANGKFII